MNSAIDISSRQRTTLISLLERHLPNTAAWVFGSRVAWTSQPHSDLDMVVFATPKQKLQVSALREALEESNLPFRVDLLVWGEIPDEFKVEIERTHVVFFNPALVPWPTAKVEDIAKKVAMGPFGSSIKVETFVPHGIPIISGKHLHGYRLDDSPGYNFITPEHATELANCIAHRGDIAITHRGTIGQVAYIPDDSEFTEYVISQSQLFLRCDCSKAIPEFVTAYFKSPEGRRKLLANASQVGVPSIARPLTNLRAIEIPLPNTAEQRAIANIFGTLDDKIEMNRRMNKTLEAAARAIFKDWFVDFGPTRAKLEGRVPYLAPEIWSLFPDSLDEENKPFGWKLSVLSDLAATNPESWSTSAAPKEVKYVDLASAKWGTIGATPCFRWHDAPSYAKRILRLGDTIVGLVRPSDGSYAFVGSSGLTGSTGFAVIRPRQHRDAALVYFAATSPQNIERLAQLADGAAYHAIRPEHVQETRVTIAGEAVMMCFSTIVSPIVDYIESNSLANKTLAKTRDILLPKLMSGEIRLRDAEAAVEAVV